MVRFQPVEPIGVFFFTANFLLRPQVREYLEGMKIPYTESKGVWGVFYSYFAASPEDRKSAEYLRQFLELHRL
jgi:hypothetical protein